MSSFPDANTLFEGQQINGQTQRRRDKERTHLEARNRREIKDPDQERSKQQIQRGTRTTPRHNVRGS
jgi:hypothetical protein